MEPIEIDFNIVCGCREGEVNKLLKIWKSGRPIACTFQSGEFHLDAAVTMMEAVNGDIKKGGDYYGD